MSSKIFVGGLNWGTDDAGLHAAFEKYGTITEATVITERGSGRSRGFGFVTFENDDGAARAIEAMNGQSLDGRTLNVDAAKEKNKSAGDTSRPNRRATSPKDKRDRSEHGGYGGDNRW